MTPDEMIPGVPYLATWGGHPVIAIRKDSIGGQYANALRLDLNERCDRNHAASPQVYTRDLTNVRPVAIIDHHEWSDGLDIEIGEETRAQWDAALPDGAPLTQAEVTTRKYPRLPDLGGMGL